jgi:hypothetical protein
MEMNGMKLSVEEFNALSPEARASIMTASVPGAKKKQAISINGAPVDVEPTIVVKGDVLAFKHRDYKSRGKEYTVEELRQAREKIAAGEFYGQNKKTGTRFVLVTRKSDEGKQYEGPIGENLVTWAQAKNLI